MDITSFAPIAAVLDTAYALVIGFTGLLTPLAGSAAAAVAIVLITLTVRALLIPVGASQVRAEFTRRRLAPRLAELRRRYSKNPELLQRKTMALYAEEKASPLAGCLPLLLQAPVLSTVYALFAFAVINGHANALLDETLLGAALGESLVSLLLGGIASGFGIGTGTGTGWLAYLLVLGVIALVAALSRTVAIRFAASAPGSAAGPGSGTGGSAGTGSGAGTGGGAGTGSGAGAGAVAAAGTAGALGATGMLAPDGPLSWLAFITVIVAAMVPLAAALYLAVTTSWTLGERVILRRVLAPR